jgi:hypothetical protein
MFRLLNFKNYLIRNLLIIKIGILTGLAVVLFEVISLFVIYRYIKVDYYLTLVALVFLISGLLINHHGVQGQNLQKKQAGLLTLKEM